jgi:hypothetical protein
MKTFFWLLTITTSSVLAQAPGPSSEMAEYYSDAGKAETVSYLQKRILNGCTDPIKKGLPVVAEEMSYRVDQIKATLGGKFSKSFSENPKIKEALYKELESIGGDSGCQVEGNDCRARLVATSVYYFQNLRPDIPGCKDYSSKPPMTKGYDNNCEIELKYRNQRLKIYGQANGGMDSRGIYTDQLIQQLNSVSDKILKDVLHRTVAMPTKKKPEVKDQINLNICNSVPYGVVYNYPLRMNIYRDPISGIDPSQVVVKVEKKTEPAPCVEEKLSLYSEFVPLNFKEGESTTGIDQIDPVKEKIKAFILANPNMVITDVSVTSSSSRTPYYKVGAGGKKVLDPESDQRNKTLADERAKFAEQALNELKGSSSELSKVNFEIKSALAGPEFIAMDLNNRFVTKDSPDYAKKVQEVYDANKELFEKEALVKSPSDLMDEKRFSNLYQAKYKPFQGFKINISGYKKESLKCGESGGAPTKGSPATPGKGSNQ